MRLTQDIKKGIRNAANSNKYASQRNDIFSHVASPNFFLDVQSLLVSDIFS